MANLLKKSLKVRVFVIFLAVAIVAVSVLGFIAYFAGENILQRQILDSYKNISNSREGEIMMVLEDHHNLALP